LLQKTFEELKIISLWQGVNMKLFYRYTVHIENKSHYKQSCGNLSELAPLVPQAIDVTPDFVIENAKDCGTLFILLLAISETPLFA